MADLLLPFPGCLVGSWRGIAFHVPDVTTPAGRRLVSIDLPGTDFTVHEDLGLANAPIRVTGLLIGDDAGLQAQLLRAVCEAPGPGTLVHPWLGPMVVVLTEPAEITFEAEKLRGFVFRATFKRWSPIGGMALSTLSLVMAAATTTITAVGLLFAAADGLLGVGIGPVLTSVWLGARTTLTRTMVGVSLGAALARATIAGATIEVAVGRIGDAAAAATWTSAAVGALARAGTPTPAPAIGAGPAGRTIATEVDPWSTVDALLAIAEDAARANSGETGEALVSTAFAAAAVAAIVAPLAAVDWESRQQAEAARSRIYRAIATVAETLVVTPGTSGAALTATRAAWRALADLRRRIHEDLDERIGRLPSVLTLTPPTRVSAWIIAQHVAGDDPTAVRSTFEDIVKRNRAAHPASLGDGPIECLPARAR